MNHREPFFEFGEHLAIDLPGARALFTTRRGGTSGGVFASLNLGASTGDSPVAVKRNREALQQRLGARLARGHQVHGAQVRRLGDPARVQELVDADGQATASTELAPMVLVADCLPIAVAGGGAVAMLHAGWRGLAAGVLEEGVRAVRELGARDPIAAAIGPGAGPCCYEVGHEVRATFAAPGDQPRAAGKLDLPAIARSKLAGAGVEVVYDAALCTICGERSLFFSHRRDRGVTGRQAGIAWLT